MSGKEELGRLFQFDLDLLSHDEQIKLEDVLGQNLTVELMLPEGESRYFNGIVSRFCQVGESNGFYTYQATLHPWFWLLTRTSDCRIFQSKTVIEIVEEIFKEEGFSDYKVSLSGDYRKWESCVQYRETDFNFISRLFEQEGIYYYFAHEDGKHTLHITDSISGHDEITTPDVNYFSPAGNIVRDEDHIQEWSITRNLQPGAYAHRDFNFKNPKANLESKLANPFNHDRSNYEIYDYPGEYVTAGEGNNYVRTRLEELHTQYEKATGEGNVRTLYTGGLFTLHGYHREDQNREYLVISSTYHLQGGGYGNDSQGDEDSYQCSFEVINSQQQYRSSRITPKPMVQGPQTAIVVGPSGEEIWTDEFGRVKVQFHWDRYGENNEKSSCWVRVSQAWAGAGWGTKHHPHIGHEVIVNFLVGDPDQPIITGRVYNANNRHPGSRTESIWMDCRNNYINMNSKIGCENIFIYSPFGDTNISLGTCDGGDGIHLSTELDLTMNIESNVNAFVGGDVNITIEGDEHELIKNDYNLNIEGDNNIAITCDLNQNITGDKNVAIVCDLDQKIEGDKIEKVGGDVITKIGGNRKTTITGTDKTEVKGNNDWLTTGNKFEVYLGAKSSNTIGATHDSFIGAKLTTNLSTEINITKGLKSDICEATAIHKTKLDKYIAETSYSIDSPDIFITGGSMIVLRVGGGALKITDGLIEIKGDVDITGNVSISKNMVATKNVIGKNIESK